MGLSVLREFGALKTVLLTACLLLCGCAALLVGGAGAGGYYVGKDERSAGQIARDGGITASVKTKLIANKHVDALDINVDTYDGVVTLRGDVPTQIARTQAQAEAVTVAGVKSVKNEVRVIPDS